MATAPERIPILRRLFRRAGRAPGEERTPLSLLRDALAAGLAGIPAAPEMLAASWSDPAELAAALARSGPAVASETLAGADNPALLVCYPEAFLRAAGLDAADHVALRRALLAVESRLLTLAGRAQASAEQEAAPGAPATFLQVVKLQPPDHARELLWRVADCLALRVDATFPGAAVPVGLFIARGAAAGLERIAASGDALPETGPIEPATTLAVSYPSDLAAGALFLCPRLACGRHVIQTRIEEVSLAPASSAPGDGEGPAGTWVGAGWNVGGAPWGMRLWFPARDAAAAAAAQNTVKGITACLAREAARATAALLGVTGDDAKVGLGVRPEGGPRAAFVVLRASVCVSGASAGCSAWVPAACVAAVCRACLDPWDLRMAELCAPGLLAGFVSAGRSLLRRSLDKVHLQYIEARSAPPGPTTAGFFPFAVFAELVGDRDLGLALQNAVVPAMGSRPLRSLFAHAERGAADGDRPPRPVVPYAVDEGRLAALLPRTAAEDWRDLRPALPDAAGFRALNTEIMVALRGKVHAGQLELSQRARDILEKLFHPMQQEAGRRHLQELVASRVPFASVAALPRPRIQELLGRLPERQVGLSLLGAETELPLVRSNTSRAKSRSLAEELKLLGQRLEAGDLDVEEIVAAKLAVAREAERTAERDAP